MDPFTIMAVIGAGTSLVSSFMGASTSSKSAGVQADMAQQEAQIEAQKHQQMVLNSRRQQMENIRNVQLSRSMATTNATSQGAQFGTGLAGGLAQATDQGGVNALGINQNLEIGNNIFGFNQKISQDKMQLSALGSEASTNQGIGAVGSALTKIGTSFGGNPFMKNAAPYSGAQLPNSAMYATGARY